MNKLKNIFTILALFYFTTLSYAQKIDSTLKTTTFSGSVGVTNNGFSIIPTFSLNSPAMIMLFSWKKNKFSFDPDIRLTPNAKRGGMVFWFRYYPIQGKKFNFRTGFHPAFNLQTRDIVSNNITTNITQMRRFLAWELAPSYKITKHWGVGLYYLQGNGMQKDGPQTSHFVNLNTSISNIELGKNVRLTLIPAVFHLYLDGYQGNYFTTNAILSHKKVPFTFTSAINKTINSDLPGNKDFLWNVGVNYVFSKKLAQVK